MTERSFRTIFGAIALYKGIEALIIGAGVLAAPLLVAGVAMRLVRPRWAWWVLSVASLVTALGPLYKNHVAMLFWVSLACALFPLARQRRFVMRAQLSIIYGFGALAKLWPEWLSGDVLREVTWIGPILPDVLVQVIVWGTILLEILLAVVVWRSERVWLWLAVALHVGFVIFIWVDLLESVRLVVFGALMLTVWIEARATGDGLDVEEVARGDQPTGAGEPKNGTAVV